MLNAQLTIDRPANEPVREYRPGSAERASLQAKLRELAANPIEIAPIVDGKEMRTGNIAEWRAPHDQSLVLARRHAATPEIMNAAVEASQRAWHEWMAMSATARLSIFSKAAELLAGPWRDTVNAATMLGQSKTCYQAEIDSACELIDFWRFNVYYAAHEIYSRQNFSPRGQWNYMDYRPLEGFVFAITPFNFTAIAGNLPTSPAIMGNVCLWKPSESSLLSNYFVMQVLMEAGLPPGVINFLPSNAVEVTNTLLPNRHFSGVHFTGSTAVFRSIWQRIGENLANYRGYPRIVGETGGKDFIFAHASADVDALATATLRGAFEFQGQKCSAASRIYVPKSIAGRFKERLLADVATIKMGDVTDFSTFMGAVINEKAFTKMEGYLDHARNTPGGKIIAGGEADRTNGWFIAPTVIECEDPKHKTMQEEIFGPIVSMHIYDDDRLDDALALCDTTSEYALTGAVFGQDRTAVEKMSTALRFAAGNFYINDKPTGAVVSQQPFGGARASGTNDKAGSWLNLIRWANPRSIKETFVPAKDYRYPHMEA